MRKKELAIGFIKKVLYSHVTTKFSTVKDHFINKNDKWTNKQRIMLSRLQGHGITIKA